MSTEFECAKLIEENERLKRGIQELSILNEIATTISSTMEVDRIIEIVVRRCIKHFHVEQANISLINKDELSTPLQTMVRHYDSGSGRIPFRLDQQITGWILTKNKPLIINDINEDVRFKYLLEESPYSSLLSVPMSNKGQLIGVLTVFNKSDEEGFSHSDERLLSIIASGSSQVIINARLLEDEKQLLAVKEELNIAGKIQKKLLPDVLPDIPGFQVAAHNIPAREVGGDFYDVIPLDGGRFLICLGDVSGKGMPAALLVANLQATIHSLILNHDDPADIVHQTNQLIFQSTTSDKFITFFLGILDTDSHNFLYCNAGHDNPCILTADNKYTDLAVGGICLGFLPQFDYSKDVHTFHDGEIIAIYTDGVTEAMNKHEEEFGLERLQKMINANRSMGASDILNKLLNEIETHVAGEPQMDDITLLILKKCEV